MGRLPAVFVPEIQTLLLRPVGKRRGLFRPAIVQSVQHHVFVVAQQHPDVGHPHQSAQDPPAVRVPVDHIPQHIQGVFRAQVDLRHDRVKAPGVAVYVGQYIVHRRSPFAARLAFGPSRLFVAYPMAHSGMGNGSSRRSPGRRRPDRRAAAQAAQNSRVCVYYTTVPTVWTPLPRQTFSFPAPVPGRCGPALTPARRRSCRWLSAR